MQLSAKVSPSQALSPDIDFPYAHGIHSLVFSSTDCVYAWPELNTRVNINQPFTEPIGFDLERIFNNTEYGSTSIGNSRKPSQTYTLLLNNPSVVAGLHSIWTNSGLPIVMRRADQKHLDYDYDSLDGKLNIALPASRQSRLSGIYYLLSDRWTDHNLFHWTYDSIARLRIFFKLREYHPEIRLLCIGSHNLSFHKEWLDLLSLTDSVVTVEGNNSYQVDQLLCTPRVGLNSPVNIGKHLQWLLWQAGLELPLELCRRKDIFINRRTPAVRSLLNCDEISKIARSHGFVQIFLEDYSVINKLILAQSCNRLIGISGSGMSLLSFMHEGSTVLEITHDKLDCPAHLIHSMAMNHNYGYCMGRCVGNERIDLDPDIFSRSISLMP